MTSSAGAPARRRPGRHGAGDRGATLVELSIVGLLIMALVLSVFEFGLLFRDHLTATDAVADAVRIGAILGPDVTADGRNADFEIVKAVREGLSALDDTDIASIVVFKASGSGAPEDQIASPCRNGTPVAGLCNVYAVRAAFAAVAAADTAFFVCGGGRTNSCAYDPADRNDGPVRSTIDTLGVYVRIERAGYTGMFADTWTIAKAAVSRLEPGVVE